MACSASVRPLFNLKLSEQHHKHNLNNTKKKKQVVFFNIHSSPRLCSTNDNRFGTKYAIFPTLMGRRLRFCTKAGAQEGYSSEEEAALVSDATDREEFSWFSVILPFLFPALGGLLFGYDIGATSSATLSLQSPELSGTNWYNLNTIQLGLVVSGSLYGALLGSSLVYPIADFLGRRRELIIAAVLYLLGGLITANAPGLGVLLAGRLLYGLGIGWPCMGLLFILRKHVRPQFVEL